MKKETLRRQWLMYGSGLDWQLGAVLVFWLVLRLPMRIVCMISEKKSVWLFNCRMIFWMFTVIRKSSGKK